jgi:predicted nucleic acid-binding protein
MALPQVKYLDEPPGLVPRWRALAELPTASPKRWMDAYLGAFALEAKIGVVTTDGAFQAFAGLNPTLLTPAAPALPAGGQGAGTP